jgi:membrane protease YdiL (CAAX protease family)
MDNLPLLNPEPARAPRSLLAPPQGARTAVINIFWNERELRAGWRLAIFGLFIFALAMGGTGLILLLHLPVFGGGGITPGAILSQECIMLTATAGGTLFMSLLEQRPFGSYGLPIAHAFGARFWHGLLWGIALISATLLLIRAFGGFSFGDLALHGIEAWRYGILWGVAFLSVGFFEEFLFRGYAQFTLASGIGFWPAATAISALFGIVHLHNAGEDKVGAFSVFVVGMFFCLTLRRTGNLWLAVGLHAAFDWGETYLYSVPDSGLVAPGHLLNSTFHGPAWLTGGTVGPEGSVMVFLVLAIAAVIFIRMNHVRPESEANP